MGQSSGGAIKGWQVLADPDMIEGISIPQMTTSRSRCYTVTRFEKRPVKYIISESLRIVD